MEKIKFCHHLANTNTNEGPTVRTSLAEAIKMVTIGIVAGAKSLLNVVAVWNDRVLAEIAGLNAIIDDSTLGRIFKRGNIQTITDMEAFPLLMARDICESFVSPVIMQSQQQKEKLIDIDGSAHTSFGYQEGSVKGYNPHKKGANCFQSLLAFDTLTKTVMMGWWRSGNTHCANGVVEFVKQLHSLSPKQQKFFRFDSGFYCGDLMEELERMKSGYLIKAKISGLHKIFKDLKWKDVNGGKDSKGWQESTFYHACQGWNKNRKYFVVRKKIDEIEDSQSLFPEFIIDKYVYFCYLCTREMSPWEVHKFYGARAVCENYIEELKNQMALGKIRSRDFNATSLLFHCSILAYNLVRWMTICLANKRIFKWEMNTIRCFLIRVAAKISNRSRRISIFMDRKHFYQEELDAWMSFCT